MIELPFLRDLVILLVLSLGIVLLFQRVRLPVVVGFLAAGVVLGPHGLSLVRDVDQVELLAEVGVILLLFTLGLEFSVSALVRLRRQAVLGGGLQVGLTMLLVSVLLLARGDWRQGLVVSGLVALSSTVIALRLLGERGELDAPHGRAALGILLLQDLLVVPMMLAIPFLAVGNGIAPAHELSKLGLWLGVLVLLLLAGRWFVPHVLTEVARTRNRELFVLALLLICLGTAWATSRAGLSLALGAFLAGVIVSEGEYGAQALADVLPLRDTFASLFFVSIGMLFDIGFVVQRPLLVGGAVVAVVALKLLTGVAAVYALGLGLRTAVQGGFALAQVGEFSFVLAQAAVANGLLDAGAYQLFLSVAVASMFATPFLVSASGAIAERLAEELSGRRSAERTALDEHPAAESSSVRDHVVIAGYGLNGRNLARALRTAEVPYLVVDTNPERVWAGRADGLPAFYGDVAQGSVQQHLGLERARALVLAISDPASTRRAVALARQRYPELVIIARTRYLAEAEELRRLGADEVVPEELETSVEIFTRVLSVCGVPRRGIAEQVEQLRRDQIATLRPLGMLPDRLDRVAELVPGLATDAFRVMETSAVRGKFVTELDLPRTVGATVIAHVRNGRVVTATNNGPSLEPGDVVVLLGSGEQLERGIAALEWGEASHYPPSGHR